MPPRRFEFPLTLLLGAGLLAGCRCPSPCCVPAAPAAPCAYESIEPGPTPDLAAVVPAFELSPCDGDGPCDFPHRLTDPRGGFEAIDEAVCQCNAATNSATAAAVELERHWAGVLVGCEGEVARESLCLTRSLLSLKAAELRNAAAGSALTSLHLLAGVEAQRDYLDRGLSELETTVRRLDRLREKGLPTPDAIDRDALAARLAELYDKRLQLGLVRGQLNGQLKRLLGCPIDAERFFWPRIDWAPDLTPVDVDEGVAVGIAHRGELRGLRLVSCRLNDATVPVARETLKVADAALGAVAPLPGLRHKLRCGACDDHEIAVRCRQLRLIEADVTRTITAAIKAAALKVEVQQQRVRSAKQAVDDRRRELVRLEKRRKVEDVSVFAISAARGRVFEAEAGLVEKVIDLKVSRVALREATGSLAAECGHEPRVCGENCCTGCCRR